MLQEQYEKHNLEMQPYLHYLAEYQKMKPERYYRQFYGRCMMRLARMFGNRLADFRNIMEGLNGIPRQYGDAAYEFEFLEGLRLCFVLWEGDEEFPPSAQILFSDNFPVAYAAEDAAYIGDVVLDYMKKEKTA